MPSGATNITGQGTATISFKFASTFNTGSVSVAVSGCGTNIQRSITVAKAAPATPGAISGPLNVCAFRGSNTQVNYFVSPVANASSYTWTLPAGITLVSGGATNSIQVTFANSFCGGTLKVRANSACSNSSDRSLALSVSTPSTPGSISGNVKACSGDVFNYSVASVTNAASYLWTIPSGTTVTAGAGSNSITLSFGVGFTGGALSVRAVNGCGQSSARSLTLSRNLPAIPAAISGPANNLCGGGVFTYSIAAVSNTSSYNWTVPQGANIITNNGTSITVSLPANFTSGNVTVAAVNGCGTSTAQCLSLSRLPATPSSISGQSSVCRNQQNVAYTVQAISGLTYTWTVPSGASITSGQGTASIIVKFGTSYGNVSVKATNSCGSSSNRSLAICLTACRIEGEADENVAESEIIEAFVYPNPGNGQFTIDAIRSDNQQTLKVYSSNGQLVRNEIIPIGVERMTLSLDKEASGLYLIRIESSGRVQELRYIKQ